MPSFAGALDLFPSVSKPPAGAILDPRHPLAQSVIACWMFNEMGGGRAADAGSNQFHAVANTTSPSTVCTMKFNALDGINGLMTRLSGSCGRFQTRASPLLTPTRFSVELRMRFTSHSGGSSSFYWGCSGSTATTRGVSIDFTSPTTTQFRVGTSTTALATVDSTKPLHHVGTCIIGGGAGDLRHYIDGRLAQSATPPAASAFGRSDMAIGGRLVSSEATHEAYNDFLVIYNRVLTADEVWDRYRRPYDIVMLPDRQSALGVASSPPPPPPAYSGAVLFPCCM